MTQNILEMSAYDEIKYHFPRVQKYKGYEFHGQWTREMMDQEIKLHEEMISASDSLNTIEYSKHFVIVPNSIFLNWNKKSYIKKKKGGKFCRDEFSYNSKSNKKFLSILELQKIIKNHYKY